MRHIAALTVFCAMWVGVCVSYWIVKRDLLNLMGQLASYETCAHCEDSFIWKPQYPDYPYYYGMICMDCWLITTPEQKYKYMEPALEWEDRLNLQQEKEKLIATLKNYEPQLKKRLKWEAFLEEKRKNRPQSVTWPLVMRKLFPRR